MSQFYDQASLVMVPSGYKSGKIYSQKPLSTSGELSFSRASNATRVNSSGLVEKVRTNLVTYSNDFTNAAWIQFYSSVTAGQADPFGGTSGTRFLTSSTGGYMYQSSVCVTGVEMTASVWVKSNTGSSQNFQITANAGTESSPSITATTSWQRVSWTFNSSSNGNILFGFNATSIIDVLIYGFQLETGVLTDYIATTSAAVSVGPVANVPRLDYSGGCPSLLLEPQATALLTFSEAFGNAAYTKLQMNVSENQAISPSGYQDADKIFGVSGETNVLIYSAGLAANTYSVSIFVKAAEYDKFGIRESNSYGSYATFDLTQGTVLDSAGVAGGTVSNAKIEAYSNGWYRCSAVFGGAANMNWGFIPLPNTYTTGQPFGSYTADGTSGVYIWGYNVTQTAYVQSYIPTLSSAVTRVADVASKTGISSLIGQTEGTLFAEVQLEVKPESGSPVVGILTTNNNVADLQNCIILGVERNSSGTNKIYCLVQVSNVTQAALFGPSITSGNYKIALAYKANDFALYVNGVQVATDTSGSVPTTSQVLIGTRRNADNFTLADRVSQALLFKTRLSNADLATLTTL